ncbi:hypothetical protein [Nonomuraea sp. B19D2]|uniref:hypothetical protein n=1 Tax=Nonomuraea sp. B19D2 TaxID=3159561 RepID=UPI0032DB0AD6
MAGLPVRIQAGLGRDAVITGWSYRLIVLAEADSVQAAVRAVAGGIGDPGNLRMLVMVDADQLDPVADADALEQLRHAPEGHGWPTRWPIRCGRAGGDDFRPVSP